MKTIKEIEFIRAISFIGVILQHILGAYIREDISYNTSFWIALIFCFCKFSVQAFFFISGFLFFMKPTSSFNYFTFLTKKFFFIIIPYFIFSIIFANYKNLNIFSIDFINLFLLGKVSYHTWYILTLMIMLLLMPIWIYIFNIINKLDYKYSFLVVFLTGLILYLVFENAHAFGMFETFITTNATRNPIYYTPYLFLGAIAGANYKKIKLPKIIPYALLVFIISFIWSMHIAIHINNDLNSDKVYLYFYTIAVNTYLLSISQVILLIGIATYVLKNNFFSNIIVFIGSNSYIAYLYHVLIIDKYYDFYYKLNLNLTYFNKYLIMFILTFIISILIGYIFNKFNKFYFKIINIFNKN